MNLREKPEADTRRGLKLFFLFAIAAAFFQCVLPDIASAQAAISFSAAPNVPVQTGPRGVAVGDLNGDGKLDLAVANRFGNTVSIRLGDGAGGFSGSTNVLVGSRPESVAIGDFNRDGKPDLAVANHFSDTVSVRLGDGAGGFSGGGDIAVPSGPFSVAIGDMNLDGKLDIVVALNGFNQVRILLGDGAGGFPSSIPAGAVLSVPISVAIADFNNDGKPDFAVAENGTGTVSILLNNGAISPTFTPATGSPFNGGGGNIWGIAAGDLDRDGNIDLATANSADNTVTVLMGDGTGSVAAPNSIATGGGQPFWVAMGDIDGDGLLDLIATNQLTNNATVLRNLGTGAYGSPVAFTTGTQPFAVAVGDFNTDGRPDLVITNGGSNNASVLLNTTVFSPRGTFGSPASSAVSNAPVSVAIGDLNGDGKPDLATANRDSNSVSILLGNGTGGFGDNTDFAVGTQPFYVAIGDFNGDGKPDLAVANSGSNGVSILLGTGTGSFGAATNSVVGLSQISVAIGDFNGDGKPDLVTATASTNIISIMLGTGTGSFGPATNFTAGFNPTSVAIGDVNGDGKPDLAVANGDDATVSILLGTGTGSFGAATDFAVGTGPSSVAIGDLNADGKLDLAVANLNSNTVSRLLGTGTGFFGAATPFPVGTSPTFVAIGDVNGDGKPDLAVANFASTTVSILFGTGSGAFNGAKNYTAGTNPRSVAIGDLNGDGKLDLAVANLNDNTVSALLNTGAPTGLVATAGNNEVTLTWTPSTVSGITEQRIYRRETSDPYGVLTTFNDNTTATYTDTTALNGTEYFYVVRAYNGTESGDSNEVSATPPGTAPDFTIAASPGSRTVGVTGSASFTVTVGSQNGFTDAVNLSVTSGLPPCATPTFVPNPVTPPSGGSTTSTLTINTVSCPAGTSTVVIEGVSGTFAPHSTSVSLTVSTSVSGTVYIVNSNLEGTPGPCDDTHCSLREAITAANANPGTDTIHFSIASGPQSIAPSPVALPTITSPVIIDGTTQPGFAGTPIIELNGASAGSGAYGLLITGGNTTARGLVINRFAAGGIRLDTAGGNRIEGNYIGTNSAASAALANDTGIWIMAGSNNNTIGGTAAGAGNVISGNTQNGVNITGATGNIFQGNRIGTNAAGTALLGNGGSGVIAQASANNNTFGGLTAGAGNVLSGNGASSSGITITGSSGNVVQGNFIGTDAAGTAALANGQGVTIGISATNTTIGGTASGARNIISGNTQGGVSLSGAGTSGNLVQGNYIGTNAAGTAALANGGNGVAITASGTGNTIGGTVGTTPGGPCAGACNLISGNGLRGIAISVSGSANTLVQGNFIGTNAAGNAAIPNATYGVYLNNSTAANIIGGTTPSARNLISGNLFTGVYMDNSANNNQVQGNYIGTNAAGTAALGNATLGVRITGGANANTIGGLAVGAGNVISGNGDDGVEIIGAGVTGNLVAGNFNGTNAAGTAALPNGKNGIHINGGASGNTIGGTVAGAGNLLSGNGQYGLHIQNVGSNNNLVQGNIIGLNGAQTGLLGNFCEGVVIGQSASSNTIGGAVAGARNFIMGNNQSGLVLITGASNNIVQGNVISDNGKNVLACPGSSGHGVSINQGLGGTTTGNVVKGNLIGTDAIGTTARPNAGQGISVNEAPSNTIGGTTAADRNIISGNSNNGVNISGALSTGNAVQGNFIGTNVAGTGALGNTAGGLTITNGASTNTIGGTTGTTPSGPCTGACNVISGNGAGVTVSSNTSTGNLIQGNFVGVDVNGVADLGNTFSGVYVLRAPNTSVLGNVLSGNNGFAGVAVCGNPTACGGESPTPQPGNAAGTIIKGNFIGTNSAGTAVIPNSDNGISVDGSPNTQIGGTGPGEGNVIAGNGTKGLGIFSGSTGTQVNGNFIGTNSGGASLGNTGPGVLIFGGATNSSIGLSVGNSIANNTGDGVRLDASAGAGHQIFNNAIVGNGGLGIDLGTAGITPNDAGDGDTGANNLQNFPVLTSATSSGGVATVQGTLNSTANTQFRIQLFANAACDASGNGEGQTILGAFNTTTDGSGNASFSTSGIAGVGAPGQFVTATATNTSTSDTSEFSACQVVSAAPAGNQPATLASIATQTVNEGQTLTFSVSASDPDGNTLALSANVENLPGATFIQTGSSPGSATGQFTWTPNAGQAGTKFVTFVVGDGQAETSQEVAIIVNETALDSDGDGVADNSDNCPADPNPDQSNIGGDVEAGDVCDTNPQGVTATTGAGQASAQTVASAPPGEPIIITVDITFHANDFTHDNISDDYFVVTPEAFLNVTLQVIDNATGLPVEPEQIPEAAPVSIPHSLTLIPANQDRTFPVQLNVNDWFPSGLPCSDCTIFTLYTNVVKDPHMGPNGECGPECIPNIWLGSVPGGSVVLDADNQPPSAGNDTATTPQGTAVSIAVLTNDSDPENDPLTITAVTQGANGTVTITGGGTTVSYAPNATFTGTNTFTYTISDGHSHSATATVTVTVTAPAGNNPPTFDAIANQVVNEDGGAQTVSITGVSPGTGEASQTVTVTAVSSNAAIVPTPGVTGSGATRTLTYQPAANANGTVTITVTANDGQAQNNTFSRTFTITVNPVNDVPSFTKGADQTVNAGAGAQTVVGWATNISAGPPNEVGQVLNFIVTNSNTALFSGQPAVSPTGTLTYTPATTTSGGVATVTVRVHDNGTTANGGVDTSAPQTFTITVKGASTQIDDLIAKIRGLPVNNSVKNPLIGKLQEAKNQLRPGGPMPCGKLNEFIALVAAQSGKALTAAQAADLTSDANRIKAVMGCS